MELQKNQNKRVLQGVVVANRMSKTATVQVERIVRHPRYNKFVKQYARYHAHDEGAVCKVGDKVLIVESRPLSKTKRWNLEKVIESFS